MAVTSGAITGAIIAAGPSGSQVLPLIASAIGRSLQAWLPLPVNVRVQGVTSGLAGSGVVTGKMAFLSRGQVLSGLRAAGAAGPSALSLGQAVETGVTSVLNSSAQYLGTSVGVSSGTDISKVALSNQASLTALLAANLPAAGVAGLNSPALALGFGIGLASLVQTGFGFGGVAPTVPAPSPAAGTSLSTVF